MDPLLSPVLTIYLFEKNIYIIPEIPPVHFGLVDPRKSPEPVAGRRAVIHRTKKAGPVKKGPAILYVRCFR